MYPLTLKENTGMLVYPMFIPIPPELSPRPDLSKAVFFEDPDKGWEYKELMEENISEIHYYWEARIIRWRANQ